MANLLNTLNLKAKFSFQINENSSRLTKNFKIVPDAEKCSDSPFPENMTAENSKQYSKLVVFYRTSAEIRILP